MPPENTQAISPFESWADRYEKHLTRQSSQIDALTKDVSALTADVRSLMRNQEALFNKTSRPFQWGAFVSAMGLVAVGAGLLITPIHRDIDGLIDTVHDFRGETHAFIGDTMEHRIEDAKEMGAVQTDIEWLKKLEERQNNRLHAGLGDDDD